MEDSLHSPSQLSPLLQLVSLFISNSSQNDNFSAGVVSLQVAERLLFLHADFSLRLCGKQELINWDDPQSRDIQLFLAENTVGKDSHQSLVQLSDAASAIIQRDSVHEKAGSMKLQIGFLVRVSVVYGSNPVKRLSWLVEVKMER